MIELRVILLASWEVSGAVPNNEVQGRIGLRKLRHRFAGTLNNFFPQIRRPIAMYLSWQPTRLETILR
jgi:hypothetical protein